MKASSRRGAVDMGTVLMILAFAVIGFFFYWLNRQAVAETALEIAEEPVDTTMADPLSGAADVVASDFMLDPSPYEGQLLRVEPLPVASLLGQQGFWLDLPSGPFLVSFSDELAAEAPDVEPRSTVRVTGTMTPMSDSVVAAWVESGRVSEGESVLALVATHYLDAQRVEVLAGPPADGGGQ